MAKEILVCLEASPSTDNAVSVALETARRGGATLVGLAIVDEPDIRAGSPLAIGGSSFKHERDEALVADAHVQAKAWLAKFRQRCDEAGAPARSLEVVGRPAASILREMEKHDMAIIGRDANFRFETDANDASTRESILSHAARPVVLVPQSCDSLGSKVLIAFDGSAASRHALTALAESGLASGREVHVATVDDHGDKAWEMADRGVRILADLGIVATGHNVVSPHSNFEALVETADKLGAGLMVMGVYGRSRLAALFTGSTTRALLERAHIPLFLKH